MLGKIFDWLGRQRDEQKFVFTGGESLELSPVGVQSPNLVIQFFKDFKKSIPQDAQDAQLDFSAFLLNASERIEHEHDFVFYGSRNRKEYSAQGLSATSSRPFSTDSSVIGICEEISYCRDPFPAELGMFCGDMAIALPDVSTHIKEIKVYCTLSCPVEPCNIGLDLGNEVIYTVIKNQVTGQELIRFEISRRGEDCFDSIELLRFVRVDDLSWKLWVTGSTNRGGLSHLIQKYANHL